MMVVAGGVCWSVAFIVIALAWRLQLYADGAFFSYAIAVQDVWAFHWHNISGRLSVFLLTLWPAETLVVWTGNPEAGILLYCTLFYAAPLLSLIATFHLDRTPRRSFFTVACASTALLGPLVFGFPTEMWLAYALFWPTLTAAHCARRSLRGMLLISGLMVLLALTHEGALVLAFAVAASLAMRGWRNAKFIRGACVLLATMILWGAIKIAYPPDDYFAGAYWRAAFHFFDLSLFRTNIVLTLLATLAGYGVSLWLWRRYAPSPRAHIYSVLIIAACLSMYWALIDISIHASNRYYMRTLLVILTPLFGLFATIDALRDQRASNAHGGFMLWQPSTQAIASAFAGAFVLIMMVHGIETAKFLNDWTRYKLAVQRLATGDLSDSALGDTHFVSAERIDKNLRPLSWFSTTQYLSIILAGFTPSRLVVDPTNNYFWLDCTTATMNANAARSVPAEVRALVRIYSCQHR